MKLTEEQIKSIVEDLNMGMSVYVNIDTNEIKAVMDFEQHYDADPEPWKEDLKEIEENFDKYFHFERMDSREAFRVMDAFVETVEDEELKKKLDLGLSLSKPFRNFKDILNYDAEYRDKWFAFKMEKTIEFVKEQLNNYNELQE